VSLIVGHDADALAEGRIIARQSRNGGRFSRSQETAEHDKAYSHSYNPLVPDAGSFHFLKV
jgi:hypothetical protein